jgi:hypothetical protein
MVHKNKCETVAGMVRYVAICCGHLSSSITALFRYRIATRLVFKQGTRMANEVTGSFPVLSFAEIDDVCD